MSFLSSFFSVFWRQKSPKNAQKMTLRKDKSIFAKNIFNEFERIGSLHENKFASNQYNLTVYNIMLIFSLQNQLRLSSVKFTKCPKLNTSFSKCLQTQPSSQIFLSLITKFFGGCSFVIRQNFSVGLGGALKIIEIFKEKFTKSNRQRQNQHARIKHFRFSLLRISSKFYH